MMFKKSNRQFRSKKAETDSEEEENVVAPPPPPQPAKPAEQLKAKSSTTTTTTKTVLCIDLEDDEEESGEEFRVKKPKESRRIAKEMKKTIKRESKDQVLLFEQGLTFKSATTTTTTTAQKKVSPPPAPVHRTYKVNSDESESTDEEADKNLEEDEHEKLQRLREEMEDLNGSDTEDIDQETDDQKRSMKIMLKSGIIPDAEMIHVARKKREMARLGDFVPIGGGDGKARDIVDKSSKSRVVREDDENDVSDEEDPDSRVSLNYREKAHRELQQTRHNFLAYEQGSDEEVVKDKSDENEDDEEDDEDDEMDQWEKEQIRKGVQITQNLPSKLEFVDIYHGGSGSGNKGSKMKIKSVDLTRILGSNVQPQPMDIEPPKQFDTEKLKNLPQITFQGIKQSLKQNLDSMDETHRAHNNELEMVSGNLKASQTALERIKLERPRADQQYVFYQEMSAFAQDFVECFNDKIAEIEDAETKWLNLFAERAEGIVKRRHEEINDQNVECLGTKPIDSAHQRRLNEREERRQRRQARRQSQLAKIPSLAKSIESNEGFSSNDEDASQEEVDLFKQSRKEIVSELFNKFFEEINEDFYKIDLIKQRFEKWKTLCPDTYKDAYIALSLPKLFSPLIRLEMVDWNPLENDSGSLEKLSWFKELVKYNEEALLKALSVSSANVNRDELAKSIEQLPHDDDFLVIPHIVEKTVLGKVISVIERIYDPMSTKQTKNLSSLVKGLLHDYPTLNSQSPNTKKLVDVLIARIRKTLDQDVFIPMFSKNLIEIKTTKNSIFFYRQFWGAFKLFGNILQWHGFLSNRALKELCFSALFNRYLMIGLNAFFAMDLNAYVVELADCAIKKLPEDMLASTEPTTSSQPNAADATIPQLDNLCRLLRRIVDTIHEKKVQTKQMDSKAFKDFVRQVRKVFMSMRAVDQAILLTNTYEVK